MSGSILNGTEMYLERDGDRLIFGGGIAETYLEAEPPEEGSYPAGDGLSVGTLSPRKITVKGYIIPSDEDGAVREISLMRRLLSKITSPHGEFVLGMGDRRTTLTGGRLSFVREAPFSGSTAEKFTLTAQIPGGYFTGLPVTVSPESTVEGFTFPVMTATEEHTFGTVSSASVINLINGGDIPVGFTAVLSPDSTAHGFSLTDSTTGKYISCASAFGSGDVIKISTLKGDLYFTLIRGGQEINLTGHAAEGSELFTLSPGEHTLTLGGGVSYSGTLTFTEGYITF